MGLYHDMHDIVNGSNKTTNFSSEMIRIVLKADTANISKLGTIYPNLVRTVQYWRDSSDGEILDLPYD